MAQSPVYFECSLCGECCTSISIPIETEKAEQLLTKPWVNQRLAATGKTLQKVTEAYYRIPLTHDNICVFLNQNNKTCMIEANEGKALKPEECKNFPFAVARHADGSARLYDASASCKKVAEVLIKSFAPILPSPQMSPDFPVQDLPKKIPAVLSGLGFRTFNWEQFQTYQSALTPIFNNPDTSPLEALKQAKNALYCHCEEERSDDAAISKAYLRMRLPRRFAPRNDRVLTWFVPLLFLRKPYGSYSWLQLLFHQKYSDWRVFGETTLPLQPVYSDWTPEQNRHLNAFLYNILHRYVLLTHGHSLSGVLSIACVGYYLVRWHAQTLADIRDSEASVMTDEDVAMAIRLVERYYTGHQPRFLAFFRDNPLIAALNRLLLAF